jgi:type II secretory pathway predicted ATPase ExeA
MTNPLTNEQRRAFLSAPDPRRYYAAGAIEEARQRIVRSIARSEGPALVVGAVGTGKSLLLAVLAEQFEPRMSVVTLTGAQLCTRRALLQMILGSLHLPYRHMDEGELRLSILEHLRGQSSSHPKLASEASREVNPPASRGVNPPGPSAPSPRPRRMLVLVDEADALPTRLLEELRVLTNVVEQGVPLVSLVLAGGPALEERFADPQLDKFSQRLACRCYLAPLTREETFQYVRSQVSAVGVKPEKWFDPEALAAVHAATGGVPRLVNQLGDQLVWLIEETGCQPLDAALVQQAWSDLQQLPAPWNTDAHSSLSSPHAASVGAHVPADPNSSVIEFGELDESFESHGPFEPHGTTAPAHDKAVELFHAEHTVPMPRGGAFDDDMPASIPFAQPGSRRNEDLGHYHATIDAAEHLVDSLDEFDELELDSEPGHADLASGPSPPGRGQGEGAPSSNSHAPAVHTLFQNLATRPSSPRLATDAAAPIVPTPASNSQLATRNSQPFPELATENPFEEDFEEEEVLVDPYAEFETQLLRSARHVMNRIDRTFAAELARCEMRKSHPIHAPSALPASEPSPSGRGQGEGAWKRNSAVESTPAPAAIAPAAKAPLVVLDDAPVPAVIPGKQLRRLFSTLETAAPTPRARRG